MSKLYALLAISTLLYGDNLAWFAMSKNPVRQKFSRHIDFKRYFMNKLVLAGVFKLAPLCNTQKGGWRPHQERAITGICRAPIQFNWPCSFCRSRPTLLWELILSDDFERIVFNFFFRLIIYNFFFTSYVASGVSELHFFFVDFMFLQFLFFFGLPNTVSLRSHYCA